MKQSALILVLSLFVTAVSAIQISVPETLDCRETVRIPGIVQPTAELVEYDLTHGLWSQTDSFGNERTYQFNEDGQAAIFDVDASGNPFYHHGRWSVKDFHGSTLLVFSSNGLGHEKLLHVELNCTGAVLTDAVSGEEVVLNYKSLENETCAQHVRAALNGEWTNITYGADSVKESFQHIRFKADGSFSMVKMDGTAVQGTWEVSKDAKFLVLRMSGARDEEVSGTVVAKISRVDDHSLVLEQTTALSESDLELQTFTFIK